MPGTTLELASATQKNHFNASRPSYGIVEKKTGFNPHSETSSGGDFQTYSYRMSMASYKLPNFFGGVFFPLDLQSQQCYKARVCVTYLHTHFSALVPVNADTERQTCRIPLTDSKGSFLPIKFSSQEVDQAELLKRYLNTSNATKSSKVFLCAQLSAKTVDSQGRKSRASLTPKK